MATSLLWGTLLLVFSGCSSSPIEDDGYAVRLKLTESKPPMQKVFVASYDSIWKAIQIALLKYPIRVNDMDSGVIESDLIKGDQVWVAPYESKKTTAGRQYKVTVTVIKGSSTEGKQAFKVTVAKKGEKQANFFSEARPLISDGLEEASIMYRIGRELQIDRMLKKIARPEEKEGGS